VDASIDGVRRRDVDPDAEQDGSTPGTRTRVPIVGRRDLDRGGEPGTALGAPGGEVGAAWQAGLGAGASDAGGRCCSG
jgi:hypothetical protein